MEDLQRELLTRLFDLACEYYTEKTENGAYKIPESQKERQFIQEVFKTCGDVLGLFENE